MIIHLLASHDSILESNICCYSSVDGLSLERVIVLKSLFCEPGLRGSELGEEIRGKNNGGIYLLEVV